MCFLGLYPDFEGFSDLCEIKSLFFFVSLSNWVETKDQGETDEQMAAKPFEKRFYHNTAFKDEKGGTNFGREVIEKYLTY